MILMLQTLFAALYHCQTSACSEADDVWVRHGSLRHWQQSWSERTTSVCPAEPKDEQAAEHSDHVEYVSKLALSSDVPARESSVVVLGGSRYFTEEYFHDLSSSLHETARRKFPVHTRLEGPSQEHGVGRSTPGAVPSDTGHYCTTC